MDLNDFKESYRVQILIKFLPVILVSVGHDIFYNFSSGVINAKNKGKKPFFCSPFS